MNKLSICDGLGDFKSIEFKNQRIEYRHSDIYNSTLRRYRLMKTVIPEKNWNFFTQTTP